MKKTKIDRMIKSIKQADTRNEIISLTCDYTFLENMNDEMVFTFNCLIGKTITPQQAKIMLLDSISKLVTE